MTEDLPQATRTNEPIVDRIATYIRDGLENGRLTVRSRLPTEREFAQMFDAPRTAIRKALAHHEAAGLVVRQQGSGTFIGSLAVTDGSAGARTAASGWADISPNEVMEVRTMIEPPIALLAARSATEQQFDRMDHCVVEAATAPTHEEFEVWDGALHRAIAEATQNHFLLRIFDHVNGVRQELRWGQLKRRSMTPERRAAYQREHERIVAAIRDRDGEQARELMAEHLSHVRENLLNPIV